MTSLKVVWDGVVFHPTGVATHHRNLIRALIRKGVQVQIINDIYRKEYDKDNFLAENAFKPIDSSEDHVCVNTYHPNSVRGDKRRAGYYVHEGTQLPPDWPQMMGTNVHRVFVPSVATKNLFWSSGVRNTMFIVPEGVDPELFKLEGEKVKIEMNETRKTDWKLDNPFVFVSVGGFDPIDARTGQIKEDRKGFSDLIKAYISEFKKGENVLLYVKIGSFWKQPFNAVEVAKHYGYNPEEHPTIVFDNMAIPECLMPSVYRGADAFVSPTKGESWGLTIMEAMAMSLPIIVPKNNDAGYMDFVLPDNTFWVETKEKVQADLEFFAPGNLMPTINQDSLKAEMRKVFEFGKEGCKENGAKNRSHVLSNFTWDQAADKFIDACKPVREKEGEDKW